MFAPDLRDLPAAESLFYNTLIIFFIARINELADKLNIKPQSMSNKLYRDSFSFQEMCTICDLLNADLKAITRDSQKEFFETPECDSND